MGPSDYSKAIEKLFYKDGKHIPTTISVLGLCGEAAEVTALFESTVGNTDWNTDQFTRELKLELGDVMWYVAAILDSQGNDCTALEPSDLGVETVLLPRLCGVLSMHAGHIADMVKKEAWHGKFFNLDTLIAELSAVALIVEEIGSRFGLEMEEICQANVDKLEARYPGKTFTEGGGIR
jgi:NTP pyrophosphatase (non-canonical NTP hydrolase)